MSAAWFITGTSSGFGRLLTERLLSRGDRVAATLPPETLKGLRAALPHLRAQGYGRILQVSAAGGQATYPNFSYYHASKWGIEGFCETAAREIAPFGLSLTIVEPGATPTGFGSALDTAPVMPEYENTPAGEARRAIASGAFTPPNDPQKLAQAIIDLVDSGATPLRLPLGSDTYDDVGAALAARLAEHDAHRDVAFSVVRDGRR
jgi:NAD(P)-dependent dehydrogenase (short-subunit alcohol dehydrogenase family)